MANDPKGRLLLGGQNGQPITRVTIEDGKVAKQEILNIPVSETMGMLFVGDVLYISGNGSRGFAFVSLQGHEGRRQLRRRGISARVAGRRRRTWFARSRAWAGQYALCGVRQFHRPFPMISWRVHRIAIMADDLPLPRMEDGNGFGAGAKPPGGYVARMDLDGQNIELFSSGQRNTYDIGFNADGELFGFDSDMEWDWGTPWYRPMHVFHAVRGGDNGFREGTAKWPESLRRWSAADRRRSASAVRPASSSARARSFP